MLLNHKIFTTENTEQRQHREKATQRATEALLRALCVYSLRGSLWFNNSNG